MSVGLKLFVENVKEVQKQVKDAMKNIPAGIQGQISGITGGIQQGALGTGAGATASTLGKMGGKLALLAGTALIISEGVKRIVRFMAASSPYLKGVFDIFKRSLMIFFRPFGDALATFLKPMALWMIKMAVAFLQFTKTPGGGLVAQAGAGAGVGAAIGAVVGGAPGAVVGAAAGAGIALLDEAWQGVKNIGTVVTAWADKAAETFLGINMDEVRAKVATFMLETWPQWVDNVREKVEIFMLETWPEFVNSLKTKVEETWGDIEVLLSETIPDAIEEGWETVKTFFTETVPGWIEDSWDGVKTFFTETVPGWVTDMIDKVKALFPFGDDGDGDGGGGKGIFSKAGDFVKKIFKGEGQTGIGFVPETGLYGLHRGEKVIPSTRVGGSGGRNVILNMKTIIQGGIQKDVDIDSIVRRSSRMTELILRRRGII